MTTTLKKAYTLFKRRINAKKFHVKFKRSSSWRLPQSLLIDNIEVPLKLMNDTATSTAFIDIFLDDCYGFNYFKRHFENVDKIVDIGANQGLFMLAARMTFPKALIQGYEPNNEIISNLQFNTTSINADIFNEAVGLQNGFINLQFEKDSLHTKTLFNELGSVPQASIAKCLSRMNGTIDLLKLDCEGAEWEILKDHETLKKVKAITLEYHLDNEHDHKSIKKVLEGAEFKVLHYSIDGPTWGIVWAINKAFSLNYAK